MSTTGNKKTIDELESALVLLDQKLGRLGLPQPIQIKAIGGFALLKHGVRDDDRAYTVDIDTVTRDYSKKIVAAIDEVASEASLDTDWLNNYNVMDNDAEHVENMLGAEWLPQDLGLRNIDVSIATVETLTRAKIIASDSAEFSERLQDVPDLLELLEHQGIEDLKVFDAKYPDPYGEYPDARRWVSEHFTRNTSAQQVAKRAAIHDRFPELRGITLDPHGLGDSDAGRDAANDGAQGYEE